MLMAAAAAIGIVRKFQSLPFFFVLFIPLLFMEFPSCQSMGELAQFQDLTDGSELISPTGVFALGFYRIRHLGTKFLAIWYNGESEPVWIANRNSPIPSISGLLILTIDGNGSLKIATRGGEGNGYSFSLSIYDVEEPMNTSARLLDNGNFVLNELNPDGSVRRRLWQSFDYPTDTLLPGMKIGINHKTGFIWSLASWRGINSPLYGAFTLAMDPNNTNQLGIFLRRDVFWTSGNWLDGGFELSKQLSSIDNEYFYFERFSDENETYFTYNSTTHDSHSPMGGESLPKLRLDSEGTFRWSDTERGVSCPFYEDEGFPFSSFDAKQDASCVGKRQHKLPVCRNSFKKGLSYHLDFGYMEGLSFRYRESDNMTMYECEKMCVSDCDCVAYAPTHEIEGIGCEIWRKGTTFRSQIGGRQIMMFSTDNRGESRLWVWIVIGLTGAAAILLLCFIFYLKVIRKMRGKGPEEQTLLNELGIRYKSLNFLRRKNREREDGKKNHNLKFYSFEIIAAATNNFSAENKLGEGGFGIVYKGKLPNGQEVAIKRLSKNSRQGLEEFKNEVVIIAELQHTNLVRLVGCCIFKEERLLIYEYMPNKSLDFFLFDSEKKIMLDWNKRINIIQGIIQGLLYLHNYSRLRIVHRDLKVSNILLDDEMNAKISDFGMARIFGSTDCEANTKRVVGTYGYMSPEYVTNGVFSTKSDVYSFGVVLLEILTGQKNYNNPDLEDPHNLTSYAWELWVDGRGVELIDSTLRNSNQESKALRCFHISLLCVQQIPTDRPSMLDIILMIHNDVAQLPTPKPPAFFIRNNSRSSRAMVIGGETKIEIWSENKMSISEMIAR